MRIQNEFWVGIIFHEAVAKVGFTKKRFDSTYELLYCLPLVRTDSLKNVCVDEASLLQYMKRYNWKM